MKKKIIIGLLFLIGSSLCAQTKEDDIRKLLDISGSKKIALQIVEAIIPQFKTLAPNVPEVFWKRIVEEMNTDEFVSLNIPIYDKYFSHEEIKQLVSFYESDIGRKSVLVMPKMTSESMQIGQEWGRSLAEKIVEELKKAGYISA